MKSLEERPKPEINATAEAALKPTKAEPPPSGHTLTPWLVVVLVVVLFSGGLFGYDQGVISGALHGIKATFTLSPLLVEVVTSWVTLGALLGALAAGELADQIGRKRTVLIAGALFTLGAIVQALAPGTVVLVGVPNPTMKIELPLIEIFGRGGSLKSSWYGDCLPTRDFPTMIELYLQGRLPLDRFVSETIGLDGVEAAFEKMHHGDVLRSVVVL